MLSQERTVQPYVQFQIVVYPSEYDDCGRFTAHCLNMDLVADDDSVEGAVSLLLELIETSCFSAEAHKANQFRSADKEYWKKFQVAQSLPVELMERITSNANKRNMPTERKVNLDSEDCTVRQLVPA